MSSDKLTIHLAQIVSVIVRPHLLHGNLALVRQVAAAVLENPDPVVLLSLGHAALTKSCLDLFDDFLEFLNPWCPVQIVVADPAVSAWRDAAASVLIARAARVVVLGRAPIAHLASCRTLTLGAGVAHSRICQKSICLATVAEVHVVGEMNCFCRPKFRFLRTFVRLDNVLQRVEHRHALNMVRTNKGPTLVKCLPL